jgi:hypothetical protein
MQLEYAIQCWGNVEWLKSCVALLIAEDQPSVIDHYFDFSINLTITVKLVEAVGV